MANNAKEAIRYFKRAVQKYLGSSIKVDTFALTSSIDANAFARVPGLVIQGPRIEKFFEDFTIKSTIVGQTPGGINHAEQKKVTSRLNLWFRMRLFTVNPLVALDFIEKMVRMSQSMGKVGVPYKKSSVVFSGNNPVSLTLTGHGLLTGYSITISESSYALALANGEYTVIVVDANTLTIPYSGTGQGGACIVEYGAEFEYQLHLSTSWDGDTVPNFSDITHFESLACIEDVAIETDDTEQVYEAISFNADIDKKEEV